MRYYRQSRLPAAQYGVIREPYVTYNPLYRDKAAPQSQIIENQFVGSGQQVAVDRTLVDSIRKAARAADDDPQFQESLGRALYAVTNQSQPSAATTEANEAAVAYNAVAEQLNPFIQAGVIDYETARRAASHVVIDVVADQRNIRQAAKEFDAVRQLWETKQYSISQVSAVLDQMNRKYGATTMMRVPGYADLVGARGTLEQAKEDILSEFAASRGLTRRFVRWDDAANRPVFDSNEIQLEVGRAKLEREKVSSATTAINVIRDQAKVLGNMIVNLERAGKPVPPAFYERYGQLLKEQFESYRPLREMLGMRTYGAAPRQPQSAVPVQETLKDAVANARSSPFLADAELKFSSKDEATAAARAGNIPVGKPIVVEGRRAVLTSAGRFIWVEQ